MYNNRKIHLVIAASFLGIFSSTMSMYHHNKPYMNNYRPYKKRKSDRTSQEVEKNFFTIVEGELKAALEAQNACIGTPYCQNLDPVIGILRHKGVVKVVDDKGKFLYNINGTNIERLKELKKQAVNVHIAGRFKEIISLSKSYPINDYDRYDKRPSIDNKY